MAPRSTLKKPPKDNATLAGLFDMDFFPTEGAAVGGGEAIFRTAAYIVEHSGIEALLTHWRAIDRSGQREGPTPWLSEVQVVILMLVLTLSRRAPLFTEMRDLLRHAPPDALQIIGVEVPEDISDDALYHRAYNTYRRLVALMNPEPGSLYRTLTKEEFAERLACRDVPACEVRRARGHAFLNAMLWGTWMLLPRKTRRQYNGDVALDATRLRAPARGRGKRSKFVSSDPEAGWYKREGNHDGDTGTSRAATMYARSQSHVEWARELHTAVTYGPDVPAITLSASLDKPGKRVAENAMIAIDALTERTVPVGHFVADRAYLPHSKPEDLALPLRARGYELVFDYDRTIASLGVQASHGGAILVEGQWYCPSMPEPLRRASIDYSLREEDDPQWITDEVYVQRLEQRKRYALHDKERPDAEGYARLQCPAVGASATVRCPRREAHPKATDRPLTRILPVSLVNPAPKVCQQQTQTFPPEVGAKNQQTYPYRSAEWQRQFTTGRQTVESNNDSIKDGTFVSAGDPKMRPRRGWVAQLFSVAVLLAATNTRKIIAWLHEQVQVTSLSSAPRKRERRRERTRGYTREPNAPPLSASAI